MENRNPNTYRFAGRNLPTFHPSFPPSNLPPPHVQVPFQSQISYQRSHPPSSLQQYGRIPNILPQQPNDLAISFLDSFNRSLDWNDRKRTSPLFNFMRENNKIKERGWLRNLLNIPTRPKNNPAPLPYHDLLVKTTTTTRYSNKQIMDVYYHAFATDNTSFNDAVRKRRKMLGDQNRIEATTTTTTTHRSPLRSLTFNNMQPTKHRKRKAERLFTASALETPLSKTSKTRVTWSEAKDNVSTPGVVTNMVSNFEAQMQSNTCATNSTIKIACIGYKTSVKMAHTTYNGRFDAHRFLDALLPDYSIVRKDYIEQLKVKAKAYCGVQKMLGSNRYNGSKKCRQILAMGVAMVPHISLESAQYLIAAVRHSTILQLGFDATAEEIARTSPSSKVLKGALVSLAASCLATKLEIVQKADFVSLATDKGHKDGVDHMVKMLGCWHEALMKVDFFLLDMDSAGNTDEEAAEAIQYSLDTKRVNKKLSSIGTDSGGGGTTDSFMEALKKKDLVHPDVDFVGPCSLHILQLLFATPIEKAFGLGGVGSHNALQLLHSVHDLEKCFGRDVWKKMIQEEIENLGLGLLVPRSMPRPVTTRWWWLGIACDIVLKNWKVFHSLAKGCVNAYGSASYPNIVASSLDSMMKEEMFYVHILFISCFAKNIINPHFEFLQSHGQQSKQAGYNSEAMLVRTFLINQDITALQDERWKTMDAFKPVMDHLAGKRWMTSQEEEDFDSKKAKQKLSCPLVYDKQNRKSNKHINRLSKDIAARKRVETHLQALMTLRPDNYWEDLDKTSGETLDAIHAMLCLPKRVKDETTGKTRAVRKQEKKDSILALELSKDQFGLEFDRNTKQIKQLDENLAGEDLGRKERLLRTFESHDMEECCDCTFFAVPLSDLFGCNNVNDINNIEITPDSVNNSLTELKEDIETTKQEIHHREEAGDDRDEEDDVVAEEREHEALEKEIIGVSDFDDNEKESDKTFVDLCVRQINIVMRITKFQNDKHFGRWANQLIFLGIASEKQTARVVVDHLLGKDLDHYNSQVYTSPIHNRDIDLYEFGRYVYDTCTDLNLEDAQSRAYFERYKQGLHMLSEGEDLWVSTNDHVSLLRAFVRRAVLIVPSNTQFVELCVKEGYYIGATNRSESQRSVLGIIRSFAIREVHNAGIENVKDRVMHANQHTSSGKIGERVMNKKSSEKDIKTRPTVKGTQKAVEILDLLNKIKSNDDAQSRQQHSHLVKVLSDKKLSFSERKKAKKLIRFRQLKNKRKKMNNSQKREVLKHTDMTLGRIAYSSLRTHLIDEVKIELDAYDKDYDDDNGIRKLTNILKEAVMEDNGKEFEKSFHPITEPLANRFPFSIRQDEL